MSDRAAEMIEKARATMRSWALIADFLDHNRDIASRATCYRDAVLVCLNLEPDPVTVIAEYANRASATGARIEADINGKHSGLKAWFGETCISFYAESEQVCEVAPGVPSLAGPLAALVSEPAASSGETR
ncbi:hypothetical protein FLW53_09330 [Microbispora sp. SCL1-1]|uniref:hypothetical protein n=1 Tax=unclassified Microbispora TaxID=2614687 RepID=UPI0011588ED7|nr:MULTISPECIES: hypothetical protein [unclassified Microbispora]NJP24400.1 hypothetical protein [Microbispora sp. CL1-1]TQS14554.1 hypothetical protein FLW53_09330 [Microbispora sp. SCL1-1]